MKLSVRAGRLGKYLEDELQISVGDALQLFAGYVPVCALSEYELLAQIINTTNFGMDEANEDNDEMWFIYPFLPDHLLKRDEEPPWFEFNHQRGLFVNLGDEAGGDLIVPISDDTILIMVPHDVDDHTSTIDAWVSGQSDKETEMSDELDEFDADDELDDVDAAYEAVEAKMDEHRDGLVEYLTSNIHLLVNVTDHGLDIDAKRALAALNQHVIETIYVMDLDAAAVEHYLEGVVNEVMVSYGQGDDSDWLSMHGGQDVNMVTIERVFSDLSGQVRLHAARATLKEQTERSQGRRDAFEMAASLIEFYETMLHHVAAERNDSSISEDMRAVLDRYIPRQEG